LREKRGLSQVEAAKRMGIVRTTYSNYEAGNREPDIDTIKKFADFFEVSIDYLLGTEYSKGTREFLAAVELSDEEATKRLKAILIHNGKELSDDSIKEILSFARYKVSQDQSKSQ